ncbi:hypothetical protein XELAEV_18003240mg [Xenopus laevis]|uniref:Uncharacterized protein n=1 Tax=Xenopus laevis TaxID=8355 RepID=A0A974BNV2_XENLA|nr:hypothetical protein XELAEV_18003240mg [Xenopus laevis]
MPGMFRSRASLTGHTHFFIKNKVQPLLSLPLYGLLGCGSHRLIPRTDLGTCQPHKRGTEARGISSSAQDTMARQLQARRLEGVDENIW